jgi:microsomal dipeptidase-like Zn-dependent dipeptidase
MKGVNESLGRLFFALTVFAAGMCNVARAQSTFPGLTNPNPIWGYADVHNHQFANLGFGGLFLWGEPFDPNGISTALAYCDFTTRYSIVSSSLGIPYLLIPPGAPLNVCAFGVCTPFPVHGPSHTFDLWGATQGEALRPVSGYPEFSGWPHWHTFDHQQVYMDWLYRAHQGGLQLMVIHGVNNALICETSDQIAGFGCDDMPAVDRQLQAAKDMETFIDSQSGGPGLGWYRIVYTPQDARTAIANGQLAVVLGIEVDNLFGCTVLGNCSPSDVSTNLKKYYDVGVRHLFPVHIFDNGFGGAAMYETYFDVGNLLVNGYLFNSFDCSGASDFWPNGLAVPGIAKANDYRFQTPFTAFTEGLAAAEATALLGLPFPPPVFPTPPQGECNARGLTPLGEYLIKQMMGLHMIIDIDHMSALMTNSVLDIAENNGKYPVVSGHTGFIDTSIGGKRAEGQKNEATMARLQGLGALVAPILHQGKTSEISAPPGGDPPNFQVSPCSESDWAWAQAYLYAVNAMGGAPVAYGSDFNGGAGEPAPRYGSEGCGGNGTEAGNQSSSQKLQYRFQLPGISGSFSQFQMSGIRTNDFNVEGLAHVGLVPDMIADLQANGQGLTNDQVTPLFHSAEAYIELWERVQSSQAFAPTISYTVTPQSNAAGWNNSNVTVTLNAAANPDGWGLTGMTYSATGAQVISSTTTTSNSTSLVVNTEGTTQINVYATDTVGNNSPTTTITLRLDKTPPVVNCASPDGLWHAADVSIPCTASDALSGLANPADASFGLVTNVPAGTETNNASTNSHTVLDVAGNSTTAGPIAGNMVDKKPPTITITSPSATNYTVNQAVAANYSCADGGSGVAQCAGPVPSGSNFDISVPGTHTFTVNAADKVGNASSQSVSYGVSYRICLLYDPTIAKQGGSTYPIKIQLCDANNANLSSSAVVVHAINVILVGPATALQVQSSGNANPDSNFRYDATLPGYIFNLSTVGLASGTYNVVFTAGNDPATHAVPFQVE